MTDTQRKHRHRPTHSLFRQTIAAILIGAMPDTQSGPTYRFHMATLDGNLPVPFSIGKQPFRYVGTVHGQYTNDELNYLDDLTLGSRYTVRGFSGETMQAWARSTMTCSWARRSINRRAFPRRRS